MTATRRRLRVRTCSPVALAFACALALLAGTSTASADAQAYYFLVTDVELPDGAPDALAVQITNELNKAMTKHARLHPSLPDGAPDPKTHANDASMYIQKHKLKAYRIQVEVVGYALDVDPMDKPKRGHVITATLSLRLFGEDLHRRVIGFAGDGASTIKADVGKKVRERDKKFAVSDALELAVADALATSLKRLDQKKKAKKKKKYRKKRKRSNKRRGKKN